jgi:hypothetical protein
MQRDMDYIREILLKIEAAPAPIQSSRELLPAGAPARAIGVPLSAPIPGGSTIVANYRVTATCVKR